MKSINLKSGRVPCKGLELTLHVLKSQIHLVRQSLIDKTYLGMSGEGGQNGLRLLIAEHGAVNVVNQQVQVILQASVLENIFLG